MASPHVHSQDAHVAVMSGTVRLGYGRTLDKGLAAASSAGQFCIARANEPHFEGSDEPCLIIGTALGGWTTTMIGSLPQEPAEHTRSGARKRPLLESSAWRLQPES